MARTIKTKYLPHPKQALFHALRYKYRNRLFLAGIGTGKTLAGCHEIIFMALANPGMDGLIASPTYPMLRDVILPIWKQFIPKQLYTYYVKDATFVLWTGQRIFLRSLDNFETIRGLNLGYAWADELAMVRKEEALAVIEGRVGRIKCPAPGIFVTTTPRGYNWLIKKWKGDNYKTIRASSRDNPYFSRALLDHLLATYTQEEIDQEIDAKIIESTGLAWNVSDIVHSSWDYDEIRKKGIRRAVGGVDWGWSVPAAIIVAVQTKDRQWYLVEEFYRKGMIPNDLYRKMKEIWKRWHLKVYYADSAEPSRIAEANSYGMRVLPAAKGSGSRLAGTQEVRQLLAVRGKSGEPALKIHRSLENWKKEAAGYHYKDADSDEVIGDDGDHGLDATRYIFDGELNTYSVKGLF